VYAGQADPVDGLLEALDDLQFAPKRGGSGAVELHHCPFLDIAAPAGGLLCAIHLGLTQGILDSADTDAQVERLDPLVRPDLCSAHLTVAS
jgi:predicted ArsR family transcriptional regulator